MVCRKKMSIYFVEDKSIHKHNSLLEKNYCISLRLHGFCLQISVGLMKAYSEQGKIKHMNFTSRAHNIVMVSSMAKWSFILVFCKCLRCLQPLSKKFKLFVFFLIMREGRLHGWGWRHWEGNRGNEWDIRRRRVLKSWRMNKDGIC